MSGNPPAAVERFVREHRVARLATLDERGRPHVVPICYAYARGRLYTPLDLKPKAVAPEGLRRVRNILANPQVQVLIDDYDEDWSRLAFVQLRGAAALLHEGAEYTRALGLLTRKYPQYQSLPLAGRPVIAVTVERVAAWAFKNRSSCLSASGGSLSKGDQRVLQRPAKRAYSRAPEQTPRPCPPARA